MYVKGHFIISGLMPQKPKACFLVDDLYHAAKYSFTFSNRTDHVSIFDFDFNTLETQN